MNVDSVEAIQFRGSSAHWRPDVSAKAVIVHDGYVLLLERPSARGGSFWDLPGGRLESADIAGELRREILEETGLRLDLPDPLDPVAVGTWASPGETSPGKLLVYFALPVRELASVTVSGEHLSFSWIGPDRVAGLECDGEDSELDGVRMEAELLGVLRRVAALPPSP